MINNAVILAAAALSSSVDAATHATRDFHNAVEQRDNIVAAAIRFDDIVPPMRRNGPAWQPKHSTKIKNKIRRGRA